MAAFSETDLRKYEIAGIVLACAGLVMVLCGGYPYDPDGFWSCYLKGIKWGGWVVIAIGLMVFGLAAAHLRSNFFNKSSSIDGDQFVIYLVIIAVVCGLISYLVRKYVPGITPEQLAQIPPDVREKAYKMDLNFRIFVYACVFFTGMTIASIQGIRFFRRG